MRAEYKKKSGDFDNREKKKNVATNNTRTNRMNRMQTCMNGEQQKEHMALNSFHFEIFIPRINKLPIYAVHMVVGEQLENRVRDQWTHAANETSERNEAGEYDGLKGYFTVCIVLSWLKKTSQNREKKMNRSNSNNNEKPRATFFFLSHFTTKQIGLLNDDRYFVCSANK